MPKEALPYKFIECISNTPHDYDDKDLLVIYSIEKSDVPIHEDLLIRGYLDVSNIIVNTMYNGEVGAMQDKFALPLLNLYVNAIEFSLKLLITKLVSHRKYKTCQLIAAPPNGYEKALQQHDLKELMAGKNYGKK
jgi:hypothetical protein